MCLLFGGPEEGKIIQVVLAQANLDLTQEAKTKNLRETAALMKRCSAFLSVDTALMHIAAAVKVPNQIVIEAPTLNVTNWPYGNQFTLVKNPVVNGRGPGLLPLRRRRHQGHARGTHCRAWNQ